jgi:hypothetical protein
MQNKFTKRLLMRNALLSASAVAGIVAGTSARAQTSFGTIVGTVTDSTGANIPGAQVMLKNNGTNATQAVKAGTAGTYTFLNLVPGSYSVTVTCTGFKTAASRQVDVTIGGTTRVDESLQTGEVTETVDVSATNQALQTDNASLGGVVEGRQLEEAPLNGRNVNNLLDFIPVLRLAAAPRAAR